MRIEAIVLAITALVVSIASGQSPDNVDRLLRFVHTEQAQSVQEIATMIRSMAGISQLSVDMPQRTIALRGTVGQIALAEWLFNELDQPSNRQTAQNSASHEYRLSGSADDVVKVFYVANTQTSLQLQEVAVVVRSVAAIPRLFTCNAPRALAVRGTAAQIAFADWLVQKLDKPMDRNANQYRLPDGGKDNVARVFYLANAKTLQDLMQVSVLVRSMADIRYAFTYSSLRALTVRGTAAQIAFAEWLVKDLDMSPTQRAVTQLAAHEYRPAAAGDDVTRVFYLKQADTAERLQEIATNVRTTTAARKLFTYNAPRALAIRGTADQILVADKMIKESDR